MPQEWLKDGWRTPDTYDSRIFEPFPESPAVYIFVLHDWDLTISDIGEIGYIGRAIKLSRRLVERHEIYRLIRSQNLYVQRWFKCFGRSELREIERLLIGRHSPSFNMHHRPRGRA